jgi:hypothetical protein
MGFPNDHFAKWLWREWERWKLKTMLAALVESVSLLQKFAVSGLRISGDRLLGARLL